MSKKQKNIQELDMNISDSSDVALQYPTLLSVWQKNKDCMPSYNLRQTQQELEYFLLSLRKQLITLTDRQLNAALSLEKKDENLKAFDVGEASTSVFEDKPSKKAKTCEKAQKPAMPARAKCKRTQSAKSQDYGFPEKSDSPRVQKNDASNRFWSFIDPYCVDITMDDTKMLEKWIEAHDKDFEYQDIPPLGVHYATQWTEDEIIEEMREGSKSVENPKGMDYSSIENNSGEELLNRVKSENIDSLNSQHSPLVQKLISSLVHENIITSPNDVMTEPILENGLPQKKVYSSKAYPKVNIDTLENRLRMQLEEIGVLEKTPKELDDELLLELKQLQQSLIPVSVYNQQKKQNLLARAKAEMARQEAQKRIHEADAKVMEVYRAMSSIRSKGKNLGKKEFCQIKTILEERNSLIRNSKATC